MRRYMRSGEVAMLFGVSYRTVRLWADQGLLPCVKTLGGHRRYLRSDVEKLLADQAWPLRADSRHTSGQGGE